MKKLFAFGLILASVIGGDAFGAVASRGAATARHPATTATSSIKTATPSANRTAPRAAVSQPKQNAASSTTKKVNARAATTQKALNSGTKITSATANTVVSEECKTKYYGCMDSFCMLENTNGGRCLCSNRNAELDTVLAEIQKLDEQSYAMATTGVERIEMGEDADDVQRMVDRIVQDVEKSDTENKSQTKTRARTLNLDAWNDIYETDDESVFGNETNAESDISNLTGDALQASVSDMCAKQIPECSANLSMLKLMYAQQIKSDCSAYENTLKQQKNASAKKLQTAQTALREAALEQHQNANKYDLGQCTIRFKQCMQTTADCGEDFSKCASMVVLDNTNASVKSGAGNKNNFYSIKGAKASIDISATTYDTLLAKKPLCDSVTKQCTLVKDQVWNTFLSEVAPQLKNAEIIAEDNARQNCISTVSSCFQKACKDNIDPNDKDGSYDMCLTRPETMLNFCKIPLNACGISTDTRKKEYEKSSIWQYVKAVMASMRVDSCTNEFKSCLQSPDRCGSDYTQCIGLDLETIKQMCPMDKLVACQQDGKKASFDNAKSDLSAILQGIFLTIDNNLLTQCQNIVNEKMIEFCGNTEDCDIFTSDPYIGTGSIVVSRTGSGDFVMDGLISFNNIRLDNANATLQVAEYVNKLQADNVNKKVIERIQNTLTGISNSIERQIEQLASDPKISMCINGRDMSQIRSQTKKNENNRTTARFPNILNSYKTMLANSALRAAKRNYDAEYAKYFSEAMAGASEYKNQVYCMAMAQGEDFTSKISNLKDAGIKESSLARLVIYGNTSTNMLKALTDNKEIVKIHTETENPNSQMIARETISSVYEPGTQMCRITTRLYPCTGFESIYNSSSKGWGFNIGANAMGYGGNIGFDNSESSTTYQGKLCQTFAEPIVSEQVLNLNAAGKYIATNSTRSNLTSYYNNTSNYNHTEDNSKGGVSLGLSVGNIDASQSKGDMIKDINNSVDNSSTTNTTIDNTTTNVANNTFNGVNPNERRNATEQSPMESY